MIAQNSRNTTKYAVFWFNATYFADIPITYLLVRLMEHMKRSSKNLQIAFTESNEYALKQVENVNL